MGRRLTKSSPGMCRVILVSLLVTTFLFSSLLYAVPVREGRATAPADLANLLFYVFLSASLAQFILAEALIGPRLMSLERLQDAAQSVPDRKQGLAAAWAQVHIGLTLQGGLGEVAGIYGPVLYLVTCDRPRSFLFVGLSVLYNLCLQVRLTRKRAEMETRSR